MEKSKPRGRGRPKAEDLALAITSEGQRMLVARPEPVAELARMVGATAQQVSWWRAGGRRPRPESARKLLAALDIPVDAWTRPPGTPGEPPPAAPEPPSSPVEPAPRAPGRPTSLEEVETMLDELRQPRQGLTEREIADRNAQRVRLIGLKSRIEYQERLVEDAIVRSHPRWAEIRTVLREVFAAHPVALEALRARLSALRAWEDAAAQLEGPEGDDGAVP